MLPEEGKQKYFEKTGKIWPYIGWWSKPESLDTEIFNNELFPAIVNIVKKYNSSPENLVIVLTNRMPKFEPIIHDILEKNNLHVNDIITKDSPLSKAQVLLKLSKYYPTVNEIIFYDDDIEDQHLNKLQSIIKEFASNILIKFYKAENGTASLTFSNKPIGFINKS